MSIEKKRYRVYIYGAGNEYNRMASYLPLYRDRLEVLGIVTTEKDNRPKIDGYPCLTVREIDRDAIDYIIIAVVNWRKIADILEQNGIGEDKIIRSHVFYNPCFDLEGYLKLKSSNVSILSNFCLGGVIYKELGLKILSPTINMFCLGKNYLEFLENYKQYLFAEMKVYRQQIYTEGTLGCESFFAKGILDDRIVWYFNHNAYAQDAIEKWQERVKRVNLKNVAVIMTLQSDEDAYRFAQLKADKKIGIYYKDLGLEDIIYCPAWDDDKEKFKYYGNWTTAANGYLSNSRGYMSPVNWIKFLNGEKEYRRF